MIARKKRDISKKTFQKAPNYQSFRDAGKEMGQAAKMSSAFRKPLALYTKGIAENRMYSRVNALLRRLILLDGVSLRGARTVAQGLATLEGKQLVKGFSFTKHLCLSHVLLTDFNWDATTVTFGIPHFEPAQHLKCPIGASHVAIQLLGYDFDFADSSHQLFVSEASHIATDATPMSLCLRLPDLPSPQGFRFFMLRILFYQEVNGQRYPLRGDDCGVMEVLEVV
ncbi:hypothetical protein [Flavobacterium luminosum]|uniref:Uncharacterized protein n=1 Tax=Flavobacterium luminosum TaxID=2949086 RepID=A0ABT0TJU2_9FLAO|nr:hypothetical protein [Flavobacterium sp. HXWNR70]MCL9807755.1 hypothetical protein [Flavobacterium sp. HXWNR70]